MTDNQSIGTIESDPGYGQLLAVLIRQRLWVAGIFCAVVAIATVYSLLQKPTYQSSMQLLVEPNYQSKKESGGTDSPQFADTNVEIDTSTQLTQMKSSQLLQKAVDVLKPEYPKIDVAELQSSLALTQIEEEKVKTKIIQVLFTNHDPVKTQKVLLSIQKVYQDYNREQQKQRLAKGLEFINEQIPRVEKQVKGAEDSLEQFRRTRNLVDPETQSKALIDSLAQVRQDQRTNLAQIRDTQAKYIALQQQLRLSPQQALIASRLSQSTRFQNVLNEIQKTDLALEKDRVRFKDRSPFVQQWTDQRQRQQKLLSEELRNVLGDDAAQGEALVAQGQLGTTDLTLANQLVDAQVALDGLGARSQSLAQTERSLTAQLERFPNLLAEYGRLQPNVTITRDTLQQLLKARQELALEIARGGFDWQVVEQPKAGKKIGPKTKQNLLLAAVAGLMLGSVIAFVRDGTDDGVRTSDEFKKHVALPLLGMMPEMPQDSGSALLQLPLQKSDIFVPSAMDLLYWQPFKEALDLLYKNIQLLPTTSGLRSLVVTSALAGEGKSTLALGLAISAARANQRVLLIDADLRRPSLHKQLGLPNDRGLSTLLEGSTPILDQHGIQPSQRYTDISVSVLTAGPTPADSARLLNSRRMEDLISLFEQSYDLVVLDAPPVLGIVDAVSLASFCWGVLLVGRIGQVTRTDFMQASNMLNTLNVIGVVANGSKNVTNPYLAYERSV